MWKNSCFIIKDLNQQGNYNGTERQNTWNQSLSCTITSWSGRFDPSTRRRAWRRPIRSSGRSAIWTISNQAKLHLRAQISWLKSMLSYVTINYRAHLPYMVDRWLTLGQGPRGKDSDHTGGIHGGDGSNVVRNGALGDVTVGTDVIRFYCYKASGFGLVSQQCLSSGHAGIDWV